MTRARDLARLANPEVFSVDTDNNVGLSSVTPDAKFDLVGVLSATSFSGDGSSITGVIAGSNISASSGTQRLVVTSQTSGLLSQVATNSDLTYNSSTNTISATQYSGTLLGNATGLQNTPSITVQDITAEQVSVAGTVNYGSVDNVSSVGIITANKGIKVPDGGVVVAGVATATSFQGSGAGLTDIELGTHNFVASGNIPNGDTVIINIDGTVSVVSSSVVNTPSAGTPTSFSGTFSAGAATYDPDSGKVIIVYQDGSNGSYATAIVGTVSGSDISFGSSVVFHSGHTNMYSVTYDTSNDKVVVGYRPISDYHGRAIIGTVSGTSISFGSAVDFSDNNDVGDISLTYDSTNSKVVFTYKDAISSSGKSKVGTVSGTSISFGSAVVFDSSSSTDVIDTTFDSDDGKVVIVYDRNESGNLVGKAIIGTVSGTSISFGSPVTFSSTQTMRNQVVYDPINEKVVVAFRDQDSSLGYGKAIVGAVSGTSISFGSKVTFSGGGATEYVSMVYDSTNQKIVIGFSLSSDNIIKGIVGTVSGTSISFGSSVVLKDEANYVLNSVFDATSGKTVFTIGNGSSAEAVVFSVTSVSTNLTSENYIGISAEAISNGATGKITVIGGINSGQTGLTTAQTYYIQKDGSLDTSEDNPSVIAGTSISTTKIAVRKTSS